MTTVRRGPFIAATWLIGLGVVLLVRQLLDIAWIEAWPLFIILVGVVQFVTTAIDGTRGSSLLWAFTWPVVTIVIGAVLLASTTGAIAQGPLEMLLQWWPILLIVLGAWFLFGAFFSRDEPLETLSIPLEAATDASIRIKFGAGELAVMRAQPGNLVDGRFEGGVVVKREGPNRLELRQDTDRGIPWLERQSDWTAGLSGDIPLDLKVSTGAARADLDLSDLRVRSIELSTGASETRVRLPRNAGATFLKAQTGAASMVIEVPEGVAARIRSRMTLGTSDIDLVRFPREADGYASPDYATAANRADIEFSGGVGSVRIVGVV
jgi:hypothetical protein